MGKITPTNSHEIDLTRNIGHGVKDNRRVVRIQQGSGNPVLSEAGQSVLRQYHMRAPEADSVTYRSSFQPFTVEDLGGWSQAYHNLIEGLWESEIAPQLAIEWMPTLLNGRERG